MKNQKKGKKQKKICCCFSSKPPNKIEPQNANFIEAPRPIRMMSALEFQHPNPNPISEIPESPIQIEPNMDAFIVKSQYKKHEIKVMDIKPQGSLREIYRFLCPICFRYYNHALQFRCCMNYICLECVENLNKKLKKTNETNICCLFCRERIRILHDIDENE